jgi:hypothetical protein
LALQKVRNSSADESDTIRNKRFKGLKRHQMELKSLLLQLQLEIAMRKRGRILKIADGNNQAFCGEVRFDESRCSMAKLALYNVFLMRW